MPARQRLDVLVHQRGLAASREKARALIMAGEVTVNGRVMDKPGAQVDAQADVSVRDRPRFVSRGGDKLAWALDAFQINVTERVCADVGASTGGFTDCLLQNGAARVYALDVGYGQLAYNLRQDSRVAVMERTNARYVKQLPEPVSLVVVDASFISLKLLLPVLKGWLAPRADIIPLIKPQFEAGKQDVGKGGVVKDSLIHKRVLEQVLVFARDQGFKIRGLTTSPLKGPAGNTEFLAWLGWSDAAESLDISTLIQMVITP
jgi:23S rRNA (cytidine1920-2'-O)/16S rRNA (cytidine1409-2'-O)-methyltransferase